MEVNRMNRWIIALGVLSMVGSGCSPVVLEPINGAPAAETPVVSGSSSGGGASGNVVLAIRGGDVNWQDNFDLPPSTGKIWTDPDTLVLFFSSDPQECANPVLAGRCTGATPFWQTIIAIPPELARNGPIDLHDPRISGYSVLTISDGSLTCGRGGGAGPLFAGTLTLTGAGSPSLSVTLEGVNTVGSVPLDGVYTPQVCGALPPVSPPTAAFAFHGADLPPAPAGGPTPDADSLVVFVGNMPDACTDPWFTINCTNSPRLMFTLPLALQAPGVIDLADPAIAAKFIVEAVTSGGACAPPGGPFLNGKIEILTSDAGGLTFKVSRSSSETTSKIAWLAFDGLYSASICP
jgi:hypothetical protein